MRIQGREIKGPNVEIIVIPRGDDAPIVLKAQAVLDYSDFTKLCPEPEAPTVLKPGGVKDRDFKDKVFVAAMLQYSKLQTRYMFIKSLEATEGLVWETIDLTKPETWNNFEQELKDSGFSQVERNLITQGCFTANCLTESKIEEARNRFSQSQATPVSPG